MWALPAPGASLVVTARGRSYRGAIEARAAGGLRLVNHVDVEEYLRGMGEVRDPSWPPAALEAQAIAARTYALRAGGELCDDQRCQVYLGTEAEYPAMDQAVARTRSQVVMYGRGLAATVYSANGGGHSASPEEGFGTNSADHPYLRPAPYPTRDPFPWTVAVALGDVSARLAYPGTLDDVRVTSTGPSGRALAVTLQGSAGPRVVSGLELDRALALRSSLFTVRVGMAPAPPPPPPPEGDSSQLVVVPAEPVDQVAASARRAAPPASPLSRKATALALACLVLLGTEVVRRPARRYPRAGGRGRAPGPGAETTGVRPRPAGPSDRRGWPRRRPPGSR